MNSDGLAGWSDEDLVPVGRRFCANLGSPIFAFCNQDVETPPGTQIAHYYVPPGPESPFVVETWYNPPAANSVAVTGYMQTHFDRMMKYARGVAAAPLVGSRPVGTITVDDGKPQIELRMGSFELGALRRGIARVAGAFVSGGTPALVALDNGVELQTMADVAAVDQQLAALEADPEQAWRLRFGTGHPQGGNAISTNPTISVVDAQFKVRDVANLHVCDGSVFPDVAGVNPQWTIMALADICAAGLPQ